MKTYHTPGPWQIHDGFIVGRFNNGQIYDIADPHCAPADADLLGEMEANARLIASAPDLLRQRNELRSALQTCLNALTDETGNVARREADACVQACAALANTKSL